MMESNADLKDKEKENDPPTVGASVISTVEAATIGTPYILNSPQVSEPPPRVNSPVPVPSVYQDERGEIHNLSVGFRRNNNDGSSPSNPSSRFRVNVLYTRAGVMRSGDLHKTIQHDFVFTGRVRVWTLEKSTGKTLKQDYGPCSYIAIPPYTPHIFEFLQESTIAEWWEDGSFFAWFYQPYRKLVQESFSPTRPGKFLHYALQENDPKATAENNEKSFPGEKVWQQIIASVKNVDEANMVLGASAFGCLALGFVFGYAFAIAAKGPSNISSGRRPKY